ncbi:hypothetical protein CBM2605_B10222 [Cupriavidus neocaledonicus]|uniref:Uncharacterized protein n=1 Tax=Cupriavidus neocaledonicus TaxID=1040979 RepID=A0ABY1V5J4_9BURK|nr:hypothetical protein CBM2605_B10222 [Cupriavidus neocaledonicus]
MMLEGCNAACGAPFCLTSYVTFGKSPVVAQSDRSPCVGRRSNDCDLATCNGGNCPVPAFGIFCCERPGARDASRPFSNDGSNGGTAYGPAAVI